MSRHRASVRPRYGRLATLGASVAVTAVAVVGAAVGFPAASGDTAHHPVADSGAASLSQSGSSPEASSEVTPDPSESSSASSDRSASARSTEVKSDPARDTTLPAESGDGRRIVFSQSRQRVWLVDPDDAADDDSEVRRTYLVSGSVLDNLDPGTYAVYSKSRWAVGIDDSGVMQYFVRFTQGPSGAAIGFHTIPTKNGAPLQTVRQLGKPQSHGCIRQKTPDAIALWDFAPVGTKVVVTA